MTPYSPVAVRYYTLFLIIWLFIAGCGGGTEAIPTPTPRELANRIADATNLTERVQFNIDLQGTPVFADPNGTFQVLSVDGAMARPDRARSTIKVRTPLAIADLRLVSIAGQSYVTNPLTRQWQCITPGEVFDPIVLLDEQQGVTALLRESLDDVRLVGMETLTPGGPQQYHLQGSIPGEALYEMSYGLLGHGAITVDMWADADTLLVTRLVMVDTGTSADAPSTWTIDFHDYDVDVEIRPPIEGC